MDEIGRTISGGYVTYEAAASAMDGAVECNGCGDLIRDGLVNGRCKDCVKRIGGFEKASSPGK